MHREITRGQNSDVIHPGVLSILNEKFTVFIFYKFNMLMSFKTVNVMLGINVRFPHK